jgi:transcriptional regulator with XRE-family HTH domain
MLSKNFGEFLSNQRNSAGLSLEQLAGLVDSSKSTLSRLENNDIPKPFKGNIRRIILKVAEILCRSNKETRRFLDLASIEQSLLTEIEEVQLGFISPITSGSPDELPTLERLKYNHKEILKQLSDREAALGVSNSHPSLKLKLQEHTNAIQEIERRIDVLYNRSDALDELMIQSTPVYHVETVGGRIVVGNSYGEEIDPVLKSTSLYTLASDNAKWLMQIADVEKFAVDDCILLVNSPDFKGWNANEIETILLSKPVPFPDDLTEVQREKISIIDKHYFNQLHYRLVSATPAFSELDHLKITLAPIGFFDYFSVNPFFDEPLINALDGSKISIRQKYGNTALTYSSTDKGTSLIPAPVSIQCIVLTQDQQIILMQRSHAVAFYPGHWSASFEETMNAPVDSNEKRPQQGDTNFLAGALRGLEEEFAISVSDVVRVKVLSLNIEYLTLSSDVITLIELDITAEEMKQNWLLRAKHREEASKFALLPADLNAIIDKLFTRTLWHPTSRMRLIQFLFYQYGIDEVLHVLKERRAK